MVAPRPMCAASAVPGSAKIDLMDRREDRVFAAALGNVDQAILPGEVFQFVRPQRDGVEGHVFASLLLDMTKELVGDVDPSRLDMRFQAGRVLQRHAVRLPSPGAVGDLDETGIAGKPELRGELRPAELALDVPRRLEKFYGIGVDQQQRITL